MGIMLSAFRQFNMLMKQIIDEVMLYEGLEISYNIETSLLHLSRMWNFDNKVFYEIWNNSIKMLIKRPLNSNEFDAVIKQINDYLGYFPAHIITKTENFNYTYDKAIEEMKRIPFGIYFDAKYDQEISERKLPPIMYHITPSIHENKILKIGLVTKNKNKLSSHPGRIYLGKTPEAVTGLLNDDKFTNNYKSFTLFEIDYKKLSQTRKIRFFGDPIYPNKAFYTYENIPPKFLTLIKRIDIK